MEKEILVAYVQEHAESDNDIGWIAGQLMGTGFTRALRKALDEEQEN